MVTNKIKLSVIQGRMARAGLGLGVRDLAILTEVSPNTIARFERGENMHHRTIRDIKKALEGAGAEFITTKDGNDGVAIKKTFRDT